MVVESRDHHGGDRMVVESRGHHGRDRMVVESRGHHGRDRMVVGFYLWNQCLSPHKVVSLNPADGEMYSIQHYVIL